MTENQKPLKFYGRRRGKGLTKKQQELLDTLLPKFTLPLIPNQSFLDLKGLLPFAETSICLEIGFGAGEHLCQQALFLPKDFFIGAEVFINGVAKCLDLIQQHNLKNIALFPDDVRLLLPQIPDQSIQKVFLLFPDPWPKKRHESRRFLDQENMTHLHRILKDDGLFYLASDHDPYINWALEKIEKSSFFFCTKKSHHRFKELFETRYEKKNLFKNEKSTYILLKKKV